MSSFNQTETEDRVVGALFTITNNTALGAALDRLSAAMFTDIQNRYVFEAIVALYVDSKPISVAGVCSHLAAKQLTLDSRKIYTYQSVYNDTFFLDQDIETLIRLKIVFDVKKFIPQLQRFVEDPVSENVSIYHQINALQTEFNSIGRDTADYGKSASDVLDELILLCDSDHDDRVASGYHDLDAIIHGFSNGSLNIIAARPGVGKTTTGLDIARSVCFHQNKPCVFFSLEMPRVELMQKIIAAELDINMDDFAARTLTDEQKRAIKNFHDTKKSLLDNLIIYDDSRITIDQLELKIPALVREKNVSLVIIDYTQLVKVENKRNQSRADIVQEITQRLKTLAMSVNVPILGLAQLNREIEGRTNNKPQLSDLRESGSIEQDAHLVIMMMRGESEGDNKTSSDANDVKTTVFHVVKNRLGRTGVFSLLNDLSHSKFLDNAYSSLKYYTPSSVARDSINSNNSARPSQTVIDDQWTPF